MHDHFCLSNHLYESLAQGSWILCHPGQQSSDDYLCYQHSCFMAGIHSCCHLSFVDYIYNYLRLLFVFVIVYDHLEYPHFSQVSIPCILILSGWYILIILRFFAWYLFGVSGCASPILYSTVNTIVKDDSEERALILVCKAEDHTNYNILTLYLQGSMMTFGYSFNIWVPLLLFPTAGPDGAPRWRKGWPVTFVFYFLLWAGFVASILLYRR